MSNYVGYALRAGKSKTGQKILSKVKDFFTGGKSKSKTISSVPPAVGKLKKTQDAKTKITGVTDKYAVMFGKDNPKLLKKFRQGSKKNLDSISKIYKDSKKEGGRIGLKGGGNDMSSTTNKSINSLKNILANRKKSKISKNNFKRDRSPMEVNRVMSKLKSDAQAMGGDIRTAGEMKPLKGESRKSFDSRYKPMKKGGRMGLKKGGGSDLGMQSVIHGVDNNKNITAADPKAKFIAKAKNKKSKKKFI